MSVLKRHPNFESLSLNDETAISIPGLEIYPDRRKTELEVGSYTTLSTVLDAFVSGVYEFRKFGKSSYRASRIVRLIGQAKIGQSVTPLEAYHQVLDFVSGMTDNYASYLARQISGLVQ